MSSNPLFYMIIGLACALGPAFVVTHGNVVPSGEDTAPTRIATHQAERDACLRNSVEMAGGGRLGCSEYATSRNAGAAATRRNDSTGAVFVSVQN